MFSNVQELLEDAKATANRLKGTGYDEFINTKGWY